MKEFERKFGLWVVRRRWLILFGSLLIFLITASGSQYLTFNNDLRVFFSKDNPQLRALENVERTYSRFYSVFFILAPQDGDVFTNKTLRAVEELTLASWEIPYSSREDMNTVIPGMFFIILLATVFAIRSVPGTFGVLTI